MRRFVAFLLAFSVLTIPAAAQRGGRGFRGGAGGSGRTVVGPRYPGGFSYWGNRGFRGGFFPRNPYFGFGFTGNWLDYNEGWEDPDYGYSDYGYYPDYGYVPPYAYPVYFSPGPTTPVLQQSPPKVIEYKGPAFTCPQADGKPVYRIAVPADTRERKIPPTYQNNLWVVQDYSFTNGTLKFTTVDGQQKQTPVRSVDRDLTLELNRECGANFHFPK
jgi:hypothetical protein